MNPDELDEGFSFTYSREDEDEPVLTIVQAVAWVNNVDQRDLEPLYNAVDATALNEFVSSRRRVGYRSSGPQGSTAFELSFEYEDCEVTVEADRIVVRPLD